MNTSFTDSSSLYPHLYIAFLLYLNMKTNQFDELIEKKPTQWKWNEHRHRVQLLNILSPCNDSNVPSHVQTKGTWLPRLIDSSFLYYSNFLLWGHSCIRERCWSLGKGAIVDLTKGVSCYLKPLFILQEMCFFFCYSAVAVSNPMKLHYDYCSVMSYLPRHQQLFCCTF